MKKQATVLGAGGFVGGRMVRRLLEDGYDVMAVSSSPVEKWVLPDERAENVSNDLMRPNACHAAVAGAAEVYNFAAKVGGIGFIQGPSRSACLESAMINLNALRACEKSKMFERYFFSSSACVYGEYFDEAGEPMPCWEAAPLLPSPGYGEEKAFAERACAEFAIERRMDIRIARYFTLYGAGDMNKDGKDHVPTALAKKWARAKHVHWKTGVHESVNIWGTGDQVRSFLHIDDAVEGTLRMMRVPRAKGVCPLLLNLANPAEISVRDIACYLDEISGRCPNRTFQLDAPTGVQYRAANVSACAAALGWTPSVDFRTAMWPIFSQCWEKELKA
jgi:GDP-D-mannose 3',5'-epimerase